VDIGTYRAYHSDDRRDPMSTSILYHGWDAENYTYRTTEYAAGAIWFHIEKNPRKRVCPLCGGRDFVLAGLVDPPPAVKGVPIGKKPVFLVLHLHRVKCANCSVIVREERLLADPKKHYTHQLARYVLDLSRRMTIADIAEHLGMSWDTVKEILKADLERRSQKTDWRNVTHIAIDEVSLSKGQRYLTVVLNLKTGRVLFVAESRKAEALAPFFKRLRRSKTRLEAVAMDMSAAFKLAVETYYRRPCAIVYDRFHVIKLLNHQIDEIRREEMRNAESDEIRKVIKGKRYLLLYGSENLRKRDEAPLEELLLLNANLCTAYILKEQLRLFWNAPTRKDGEEFLREWVAAAQESGIKHLIRFAKTIHEHWEGLLAYFDHPITTGPLEGVNNSIKVMKRKAYGYRDVDFFKLRILFIHECKSKFVGV
jgi:transposase